MYAIVELDGEQYLVEEGKTVKIDELELNKGDTFTFDRVMLISSGDENVSLGQPYISGATVQGKVLKETKGDKVVSFKYRRRKSSLKKKGHRQRYTEVAIEKISG